MKLSNGKNELLNGLRSLNLGVKMIFTLGELSGQNGMGYLCMHRMSASSNS